MDMDIEKELLKIADLSETMQNALIYDLENGTTSYYLLTLIEVINSKMKFIINKVIN